MEGSDLLPSLIQQEDWMVKLDLKDACLLVGANPFRSASPPPVSVAKENLPVSSLQAFSSTLSVYQAAETSSEFPSSNGHLADHISRWYINAPSSQRPVWVINPTSLWGSRPIDKQEEITFNPSSMSGILVVSNMLLHSNDICAKWETPQNQPGCL